MDDGIYFLYESRMWAKQSVHGAAGLLLLKSRFYGSSLLGTFKLGLDGLPGAASSTWLTALRPSCFWSPLGCLQVKCISLSNMQWQAFGQNLACQQKLRRWQGKRSVNGNAQVAGHQFYPRSRLWLIAAGHWAAK